jgi:tRNA threonylcarbamoyladenosine biosynthesis protein TsaE
MADLELQTATATETQALGEQLGRVLVGGEVLALEGGLGAGKTCFVQGLARGLGVPPERRVASPTFTLVNEHSGRVPLYHVDLYRLERADELEQIGLGDYLESGGVTVVEWFDRFPDEKPRVRIDLRFEIVGHEARRIYAVALGRVAEERLTAWQRALGGPPG